MLNNIIQKKAFSLLAINGEVYFLLVEEHINIYIFIYS